LLRILLALAIFQSILWAGAHNPANRRVEGLVSYRGGEPAAGAAVQLEDQVSLQVISTITDRDGRFHFTGLSTDRDYQIRATKKGYWSRPHNISKFSSRAVETVNLELRPQKGK
jgi:hypothetical protein